MDRRVSIARKLGKLREHNIPFLGTIPVEARHVLRKLIHYTFEKFPVPESHLEYIQNNLGINITPSNSMKPSFFSKENARHIISVQKINTTLIKKWSNTEEAPAHDLELRAIETLFQYGHFSIDDKQYKSLVNQIESLKQHLTANNY